MTSSSDVIQTYQVSMAMKTMTAFIRATTEGEWEAYQIGLTRSSRDHWIRRARLEIRAGFVEAARISVRAAREQNHQYLKSLKAFNALKAASQQLAECA